MNPNDFPTPPPPPRQPEWATWVKWRSPAHKIHTTRGLAHQAISYHVGIESAVWRWEDDEWKLFYHFPQGFKYEDLPWRQGK